MHTNNCAAGSTDLPRIRKIRPDYKARRILRIGMPQIRHLFVIRIFFVILLSGLVLAAAGYIFNEAKEISPESAAAGQLTGESGNAAAKNTYDYKSSKETEIPGTFKIIASTGSSASGQANGSSDVLSAYVPPPEASAAGNTASDTHSAAASGTKNSEAAGTYARPDTSAGLTVPDGSTIPSESSAPANAEPTAAVPTEPVHSGETQPPASEAGDRFVVPFFYVGDQFGTLSIPSADINVNLYQGDSEDQFKLGAGHYCGSLFPGQGGNIVIASHCTTYFRNFEYLKTGDEVKIETTYGRFTYQIQEIRIVDSNFDSIVDETDQERLTMYTCYPFTDGAERTSRYVVICELVESAFT